MLLKSTASAKQSRRRMILFSLPVVLLTLFVAWKLLSMPVLAQRGIDAYERGNFERSVEASDSLMFLNVAEPWIPYFNRGTANAAAWAYSDATDDLAKALERAPEERRCDVRVNLALAWEMQGDSYFDAGYFAGAARLYETAKAVLDAGADEGCFEQQQQPPGPEEQQEGAEEQSEQPDGETAERLEQADERVTEKLRQSERQQERERPEGDTGDPADEDSSGGGGKLDELRERGDEAEEEKQNQDSTQRGQDGSRNYVEKPW